MMSPAGRCSSRWCDTQEMRPNHYGELRTLPSGASSSVSTARHSSWMSKSTAAANLMTEASLGKIPTIQTSSVASTPRIRQGGGAKLVKRFQAKPDIEHADPSAPPLGGLDVGLGSRHGRSRCALRMLHEPVLKTRGKLDLMRTGYENGLRECSARSRASRMTYSCQRGTIPRL